MTFADRETDLVRAIAAAASPPPTRRRPGHLAVRAWRRGRDAGAVARSSDESTAELLAAALKRAGPASEDRVACAHGFVDGLGTDGALRTIQSDPLVFATAPVPLAVQDAATRAALERMATDPSLTETHRADVSAVLKTADSAHPMLLAMADPRHLLLVRGPRPGSDPPLTAIYYAPGPSAVREAVMDTSRKELSMHTMLVTAVPLGSSGRVDYDVDAHRAGRDCEVRIGGVLSRRLVATTPGIEDALVTNLLRPERPGQWDRGITWLLAADEKLRPRFPMRGQVEAMPNVRVLRTSAPAARRLRDVKVGPAREAEITSRSQVAAGSTPGTADGVRRPAARGAAATRR